jgi:mRNA interferase RelE/StbE
VVEYRILLKSSAAKEIEGIGPREDRRRIVKKIADLAANPRTHGTEKLAGHEDRYRIRQGSYRIVHLIDDSRREVIAFRVGRRKDVYR